MMMMKKMIERSLRACMKSNLQNSIDGPIKRCWNKVSALSGARDCHTAGGFRIMAPLQQQQTQIAETIHGPSDIILQDLTVNRSLSLKRKPQTDGLLKFGAQTTDHFLQISWNEEEGWMAPEINPIGPLQIHPCAQVLHYATECFEGMKAYKDKNGRIRLFRPEMNMKRFISSVQRIALPEFDTSALLECIKELLRVEYDWVPDKEGFSIYIRPTMIATQASLGVQVAKEAMLFVVLSPVGPYFPTGLKPINLMVDSKNVRAFHGGVGDKKVGGNYAPTLVPQQQAHKKGCSQVLYVLGDQICEAGAMNMFFLFRNQNGAMELVTPALDGLVLPGVTRDTVLTLSKQIPQLNVSERLIQLSEVEAASAEGRLVEVFGTGTACMLQPVSGLLKDDGEMINIPFDTDAANYWISKVPGSLNWEELKDGMTPFSLCGYLTRAITDIQYGHTENKWSHVV